jgi:hypothetical protein
MTKYAVMIPFDEDDYIYITRPTGEMYEVEPILYNSIQEAQEGASIWGPVARIVEYKEDRNATTSGT